MNFEDAYGPPERRSHSAGLMKSLIVTIVVIIIIMGGLTFLVLYPGLIISHKLWCVGFVMFLTASMLFAFLSSKSVIMKYVSAILFGLGIVFFYTAVWLAPITPEYESRKTIGLIVIAIIIVCILVLLLYSRLKKKRKKRAVKVMVRKKT